MTNDKVGTISLNRYAGALSFLLRTPLSRFDNRSFDFSHVYTTRTRRGPLEVWSHLSGGSMQIHGETKLAGPLAPGS